MELRKSTPLSSFQLITLLLLGVMIALFISFIGTLWSQPHPLWFLFIEQQGLDVLVNTSLLMIGSALLAIVFAIIPAYFMSLYRFRFKKWVELGMMIPLALPSYVYGYLYGSMTSVTGFLYPYFSVLHLRGAIFLFALSLYPYLYLGMRAFLVKQPQSLITNAQTLGLSEKERFFKIFLPLLKPVIIGSSVLVMMEVLNDYGLVSYFGIPVVSTSIFQLWFNGNDLNSATRLAALVVIGIIAFIGFESWLRKHPKNTYSTTQLRSIRQMPLTGKRRFLFWGWVALLTLFSIGFPVIQLSLWFLRMNPNGLFQELLPPLGNTLILGFTVALLIMFFALMVANVTRYQHRRWYRLVSRLFSIGYSLPGVLIALTVFLFVLPLERFFRSMGFPFSFRLTTGITILIIALVIRYLAIGIQFVESSYQKIGTKFTYASYSLQKGKWTTLFRVDMPMMAQSLVAALLIIFIDVFKELPITLFLRPFNYQTLATRLYQFASDEQLVESSLMIVTLWILTGLVVFGASQLMIKEDAYELNH